MNTNSKSRLSTLARFQIVEILTRVISLSALIVVSTGLLLPSQAKAQMTVLAIGGDETTRTNLPDYGMTKDEAKEAVIHRVAPDISKKFKTDCTDLSGFDRKLFAVPAIRDLAKLSKDIDYKMIQQDGNLDLFLIERVGCHIGWVYNKREQSDPNFLANARKMVNKTSGRGRITFVSTRIYFDDGIECGSKQAKAIYRLLHQKGLHIEIGKDSLRLVSDKDGKEESNEKFLEDWKRVASTKRDTEYDTFDLEHFKHVFMTSDISQVKSLMKDPEILKLGSDQGQGIRWDWIFQKRK